MSDYSNYAKKLRIHWPGVLNKKESCRFIINQKPDAPINFFPQIFR